MKESKYILHLPSWYPNKYKPFEVSYLKDQVTFLSTINKGIVACVIENEAVEEAYDTFHKFDNHTEYIRYIPLRNGIIRQILYFKTYFSLIKTIFRKEGKPSFCHVHILFRAGLIGLLLNRVYGIQYLCTEHDNVYLNTGKSTKKNKIIFFNKQVVKKAFKVVAVSNYLSKCMMKYDIKASGIIYNPIDTNVFNYAEGSKTGRTKFIHVSHLDSDHKNPEGILQAFKNVLKSGFECKLVMIGSNLKNLKNLKKLPISKEIKSNIKWIGPLNSNQIAQEMKEATAFILFSRYESFSIVIAEALCSGLVVIASKCGGPEELVDESLNGILVESENINELTRAIEKVITINKLNQKKISEQAKLIFDATSFIGLYKDLYSTCLLKSSL